MKQQRVTGITAKGLIGINKPKTGFGLLLGSYYV